VAYLTFHPEVAEAVREGRIESGRVHYWLCGLLEGRKRPSIGPNTLSAGNRSAKFSWTDRKFVHSGEVSVRGVQTDSELAVYSPIWCHIQLVENQVD
jgi:hypothetical protein